VLIVHGYAEYGAPYRHVARVLVEQGAAVYAPDHIGHCHSDGERALITSGGLAGVIVQMIMAVRGSYRQSRRGIPAHDWRRTSSAA